MTKPNEPSPRTEQSDTVPAESSAAPNGGRSDAGRDATADKSKSGSGQVQDGTNQKRRRKGRGWLNREVFGWAMFDFANQAFTLVIMTTMFQLYFINVVVVENESLGRQLWAASNIVGQAIIILISPIVGALADFSGAKKRLLVTTYIGCVLCTAALGLITPGAVAVGMMLFILAYLFFATGENFLGAFLPELAAHRDMGKVSAFGFTLGYGGGLLCLAGAVVISLLVDGAAGFRWICLWAAAFFFLGGLPTVLLLRERKLPESLPAGQTMYTVGFHRIASTFRSLREFGHLFRYLLIMTFYLAGMQIVILFGGTIARTLFDLTMGEFGIFITLSTVSAIAGAFVTMMYQDRVGTRNTIIIALGLWAIIMVMAVFISEELKALFWIVGGAVGFGMGMLGTSSRAMVGLFSPQHKSAEFFGFYGLAHKAAAILGLSWAMLAELLFEWYNLVVASASIFFFGGIIMMLTVNEKAGRISAIKSAHAHIRLHRDYLGEIQNSDNNAKADS